MPKKSVRRSLDKRESIPFVYVDLRLTKGEEGDFEAWCAQEEPNLAALIEETVQAGYKLSLTYDLNHDCMLSSCTCVDDAHENYNACVTSRHPAALKAMMMTFYKVYKLLGASCWRDSSQKDGWG